MKKISETYKLIDTEVRNELINEIIDIWRNQYQGLALGRLWTLDEMICELEKDKARLDWIEKTGGRCGQYAEGFFAHELAQGDKFEHGATLRAAIDAAMEAEEEDWFERERHDKIMSGMDAEDYE